MIVKFKFILLLLILLFGKTLPAQQTNEHLKSIDSLSNIIKSNTHRGYITKKDQTIDLFIKIGAEHIALKQYKKALNALEEAEILLTKKNKKELGQIYTYKGEIYEKQNSFKLATTEYQRALKINLELGDKKAQSELYYYIGNCYFFLDDYKKALDNMLKSNQLYHLSGNKKGESETFNEIGNIYWNQGNYNKALNNYLKAAKLYEITKDSVGIANTYYNLGYIYLYQEDYKNAFGFFSKELEIATRTQNKEEIGNAYNGLGDYFEKTKNYEEAIKSHTKCLALMEEVKDSFGISRAYGNIGVAYSHQYKFAQALTNFMSFLQISKKVEDQLGLADANFCIGEVYLNQNKLQEALIYLNQALSIYKEMSYNEGKKETYFMLSKLQEKSGNYKKAYDYYVLYSDIKDSLFNEGSYKQIAEMGTKYESEKKEKDIALLTKDKELQESEINKQKIIRNGFIIGLIIAMVLALLTYIRNSTKQKLNSALSLKNDELTQKNTLIERQQVRIVDSINYAQRIQQSILVDEREIKTYLPESFIFHRPKDIVSGDFYWFAHINNKIIIAAVDCTGHGVPGAFMSMVGNTLLNQIVNEKHITTPSEILYLLNIEVFGALRQEQDSALARDSMDIALCCIDLQNSTIEYAGARNPLYIVTNNTLKKINADTHTIGSGGLISKKSNPADTMYTNHSLPIENNSCIYLFTDGYKDQFGGSEKKRFGSKRFKELLLNCSALDIEKQKENIINTLNQWQGEVQQIDDILVIGFKFPFSG